MVAWGAIFAGVSAASSILGAVQGSKLADAAGAQADAVAAAGAQDAAALAAYAGQQDAYAGLHDAYAAKAEGAVKRQARLNYEYAMRQAGLEEKEIPLLLLSIEREVDTEEREADNREIARRRQLNGALASQVALRTAQGVQAYDGSPLAMMGADIKMFERDQAIDAGETARRIIDKKFFGSERAKLMSDRVSLLRYGADIGLETGLEQAELVGDAASLQADAIRLEAAGTRMSASSLLSSSQLEAESIRIGGKQAQTSGYINAVGGLANAAYRYGSLGG